MAISVFEMFKVGIGPSSSHTVGPMRAALTFASGLKDAGVLPRVRRVKAELYGSLGATGKGHGSDKAVLLGLEGEAPDLVDPDTIDSRLARIREGKRLTLLGLHPVDYCEKTDLVFLRRQTLPYHPNGMRLT
ncbi:serine dehydratase beta chain, partial [Aromatoleum evansii]|uniref:serine dehydratase beta chain n=1 Tax=Aromatoleum evansii TaxID=59406 RepID=UPI0016BB5CB5